LIYTFVVLFAFVLGLIDINPKFHIKKLKSKALEGFVSGFLIVIFSLSCVAPIVASAVSFAFTFKHSYVIFVCLFFMGIGLSLPYILAGFFGLKFSMKNGGIGEKVIKFVSGLSVILTLFYLMTVLRSQVGNVLTILVFGMSVAFAFLVYRFRAVLTFVIGAVLIVTLPFFTKMEQKLEVQASVPFSLQNIEKYLSSGHTIFLNVEASWCITCKTNEVSAFGTQDFKSYLSKNNIIYMKADLTIKNKEVEDFVKSFGGFGVPFYLIFAGNEREHKILPLLLTSGTLINEIEEFKNKYAYKRGK
jgi:thiol:disulfide interchange protein